jgi:hypothetical protein
MPDNAIESMRERLAEQIMSDERLLGTLPENATQLVLDHALARLDGAAARAASVEELEAEATAIRADAWSVTEQASASDDPEQTVRALLGEAETPVMDEGPGTEGVAAERAGTGTEDVAAPESAPGPEQPAEVTREEVPAPPDQEVLPQPDVESPSPEQARETPSLWERVRDMWRGFGRNG